MAVDARVENPKRRTNGGPTSLTYAHDGEVVLLWGFVPAQGGRARSCMAAGFRPSLATWRAPATADSRDVAARMARVAPVPDSATHREPGAPPPPIAAVLAEAHGEWVQHAWMRWAALMGTSGLQVGPHRFEFMRPAQADGTTLVLRYRKGKDDLRVALDVARHPLIYDVTVSMGARGSAQHLGIPRSERVFPGVAWEDFPTLVAAIEPFVTVGPIRPAAPAKTDEPPPLAPRPAPPAAKTTRAGRRSKSIDPSIPRPVTPTSPSWIDAVLDHFNRTPGPRLAVQRQRANGAVFVVHPEGTTPDRALASIDVLAEQIDEIRWLDHTLRVPQQEAILGRMEQALDAAADEPEDGRPSPLEALITMMRNRGLMQLGVDVEASPKLDRTDGYRPLAEALRDLAEPSGITPIELQAYLERSDLMAVAEVVGRALGADPPPLRALMSALWDALDEDLPLVKLRQPGPTIRIPEDCLFEDHGPTALLLVVGDRRRLRRVKVRVLERPEDSDQVLVEDTTDSLEPGDAIHHHTRSIDVLFELHAQAARVRGHAHPRAPGPRGRPATALLERSHDRRTALPGRPQGGHPQVLPARPQLLRDRPQAPDRGPHRGRRAADARGAAAHQQRRRRARHELRRGPAHHHPVESPQYGAPRRRRRDRVRMRSTMPTVHETPGSQLLARLVPPWRDALPPHVSRVYFDGFVARNRDRLIHRLNAMLAQRGTRRTRHDPALAPRRSGSSTAGSA
jgi:hypothetical protein